MLPRATPQPVVLPAVVALLLPSLVTGCVLDRTGRSGTAMLVRDVQANAAAAEYARQEIDVERRRIDEIDARARKARQNLAQSNATAESLVESVNALAGDLQQLRNELERSASFDSDVDYRLADMEFRLMEVEDRLGIEPAPMVPPEPEEIEEPPADAASGAGDAAAAAADAGVAPGAAEGLGARPVDDADASLVDRARADMEADEVKRAMKTLRAYLDAHPDGTRAAEAWVLLGDCYYALGKYKEAISSYETFVQSYPDHERLPAVMLQQGLAFIELGTESDLEAARVFLDDLVDRFPDSPEAARARKKIEILE